MNILRTLALAFVLTVVPATGPPAKSPRPAPSAPMPPISASGVGTDDLKAPARDEVYARQVLEGLAATYSHLEGITVRVGATPNGEEAVSYYTEGEIVIDRVHTVGIETILAHEVWHIVDWRDNGQIDWGEDIPPSNADTYALR